MAARIYTDQVDYTPPIIEEWMDDAACVGWDPELFYRPYDGDKETAKDICNKDCPVRLQCLARALSSERGHRRYGVVGGLDPTEREALQERLDAINNNKEENHG